MGRHTPKIDFNDIALRLTESRLTIGFHALVRRLGYPKAAVLDRSYCLCLICRHQKLNWHDGNYWFWHRLRDWSDNEIPLASDAIWRAIRDLVKLGLLRKRVNHMRHCTRKATWLTLGAKLWDAIGVCDDVGLPTAWSSSYEILNYRNGISKNTNK